MGDLGEAVLAGDLGRPLLDLTALDLDRAAAGPADQVVVMMIRAEPVDRFAGVGAQRVDRAGGCHLLQRPIDGGQADAFAALAEFVVQFLRRAEIVQILQQRRDGGTLAGRTYGASHCSTSSALWVTAATTISAR